MKKYTEKKKRFCLSRIPAKMFLRTAAALTTAAVTGCCCFSCSEDGALTNLLGISAAAPLYSGYKVLSDKQIAFYFSKEISVISAQFEPSVQIETGAEGKSALITLLEERRGGERFIADLLVEDKGGNTLNILVPFRTRNDRIPQMQINEIRFDYSKPRSEFIELKMNSEGNLGALRLFAVSAGETAPIYEFPPVEVKKDEYVLLHLRTLPSDNGIDELENNLKLAASSENKANADLPADVRDIWVPSNKKLIHKTEVLYLMDQDDNIIDGLIMSENEKAWTKNEAFSKAAELLAKQNMWLSKDGVAVKTPQFEDTVKAADTTLTRTLCRNETKDQTHTAKDWYVCATSKGSPGKRNSDSRHQ